jgi:o-succinylbenzoate synthase
MRIIDVKFYPFLIKLKKPFKFALDTSHDYAGVLVKLTTDSNIDGWGEAAPSLTITNETQTTVLKTLQKFKPFLIGKNPLEIESIVNSLDKLVVGNSSAKASIDLALYDILGKYLGLSLRELFGGNKREIKTSITIGIKSCEEVLREAKKLVEKHKAKIIKLKLGSGIAQDLKLVKTLREFLSSKIKLRLDANQAYSVRQAIKLLKCLERYEIEFIEQPINCRNIKGLREIRNNTSIPIMVDESLHTPQDAIEIIRKEAADLFNIKLMKSGGLTKALKIADIATAAGIPCMVGCMIETRLGITAGMHLALGKDIISYADLDGYLDLEKDPVKLESGVRTENGINRIISAPGLGVEINSTILSSIIST